METINTTTPVPVLDPLEQARINKKALLADLGLLPDEALTRPRTGVGTPAEIAIKNGL